ncbi:MAG: hypothetical protein ACKO6F_12370 [Cyanobium sp.]
MPSLVARAGMLPGLLALLVGGCSGTPFGESLSNSFSGANPAGTNPTGAAAAPPAAPAAPPKTAVPRPGAARPGPAKPGSAKPPSSGDPSTRGTTGPATGPPPATRLEPPANPAPYRLTILLPQADTAAPAEAVTRALRAAGVPFEVETIQRAGASGAPAAAPAGSGRAAAPAAPVVRPAPPPP